MSISRFSWLALLALVPAAASWAADVVSAGARGDGTTDDTAAVQKAVNAGGEVHFPRGNYRLTRTITIDLERSGFVALTADGTARVLMAGAGPAFEFVGTHAGSAAPEQFKPNVWERQRTPRVDGLEIVGAHAEADGIAARGTMQLSLMGVTIREARHAIRLYERNRNVLISDCHLYHNRGIGIFLDAVNQHQTNITGSHISYNGGGGIVVRGGNVRNVQIGNCDIEANMAAKGPATANVLLDSTGGSVGEVAITGCTIQHADAAPNSANVRVLGRGEDPATAKMPARINNEGHVTITGNVLSDVQVNIDLQNARGVTITGNTFWMGFAHDILVQDSSNIVVGPNNLDRNPRYEGQGRAARGGVAFLRSRDCTVTGLLVSGVHGQPGAVRLEDCVRCNISGVSILDCDGVGLALQNTSLTRVGGCVIRDDRAANPAPALAVNGGYGNSITGNVLDRRLEIAAGAGSTRDNEVVPAGSEGGPRNVGTKALTR